MQDWVTHTEGKEPKQETEVCTANFRLEATESLVDVFAKVTVGSQGPTHWIRIVYGTF